MTSRILLLGSGGREHALAWKLSQSTLVDKIFVLPGNGGTAKLGPKVQNVTRVAQDFASLLDFAVVEKVNLLVPGPEAPLVDGIADYFHDNGPASISVFGCSRAAARMEGSKAFAKEFMKRHAIPTAAHETFTTHKDATAYLEANKTKKLVLKADGLAAGKGVIIPSSYEEAQEALKTIMVDKAFGSSGDAIVIEECLEGEELSILSFCDGYTIKSLPAAQDHKRAHDGDNGPNTGGMGCYAPAAVATAQVLDRVHREILQPTIDGMRLERFPFVGCLFTGLMLTNDGPKVIEYNVRFGDPETQTVLPLLQSDLAEILLASAKGYLSGIDLSLRPDYSTTVVVAAGGYPGAYEKGITMEVQTPREEEILHFHAGTALSTDSKLLTSGGRVIASTGVAQSLTEAVQKAYRGVSLIAFKDMHFRNDIAWRELQRAPVGSTAMTYATAGVSISHGNALVQRIKPFVRKTRRPGCDAEIGGFGGAIVLSGASTGYPSDSPTIVAAIDGVGTKLLIATEYGKLDTVGIDLVAMNVNDLVVQGAEPLAFLDYYACGHLDVDSAAAFVKGVAEGCIQAGCALVGGETAEMPGLYTKGDFDAAGCAIGALKVNQKILPDAASMQEGDVLIGLASSGVHSNGFSLVRKIVSRSGLSLAETAPWDSSTTVGSALLEPTRVYVKSVLNVLSKVDGGVKGMAHITGGGLIENIPRMLPDHLAAKLALSSWPVPTILQWLKKTGEMDSKEFATTFNTGLGMVLVVGSSAADAVMQELGKSETVFRIGSLIARQSLEGCILDELHTWDSL